VSGKIMGQAGKSGSVDRFDRARAIAEAVLYEGYVLYPYRASSAKNQLRWQFGVLVPRAFSERDSSERSAVCTECLVRPEAEAVLRVRARCLQVQHRFVEASDGLGEFVSVDQLEVDGTRYVTWDEAIDRVVDLPPRRLERLAQRGCVATFGWSGGTEPEPLRRADGVIAGRLVRRSEPVQGRGRATGEGHGHGREHHRMGRDERAARTRNGPVPRGGPHHAGGRQSPFRLASRPAGRCPRCCGQLPKRRGVPCFGR
jgi:hypothetical protein